MVCSVAPKESGITPDLLDQLALMWFEECSETMDIPLISEPKGVVLRTTVTVWSVLKRYHVLNSHVDTSGVQLSRYPYCSHLITCLLAVPHTKQVLVL